MVTKREAFTAAHEQLYRAICALGIGDIDGESRQWGLDALSEVRQAITNGFAERDAELRREEEARVIKAYREGRVTISEPVAK